MYIPHITFKQVPLEKEEDFFHVFFFDNEMGWANQLFDARPELKPLKRLTVKARDEALRSYLRAYRKEHAARIEKQREHYEHMWRPLEFRLFLELANMHEIDWPKNRKITAFLSHNPVCPRFLDSWSFFVPDKATDKRALEVILHESSHFLFFEKWNQVFPKADPKTFEAPHKPWLISELMAPILLNQKQIQNLLPIPIHFIHYPEHKDLKIEESRAVDFLKEAYEKRSNFRDFLLRIEKNKIG